ncbi:hypothetical protein STCU_11496 [Strigomonas culicis]|uniref:Uncharacterized protein n=1 Tax=Strigomonas culicis TaxID=28005 RepID=S9V098_9TRYP|nr:hypothetical protein STCU_11496 [Strigomonas culicis]|eukprot:EPY16190.1 hypothetical protein STCU_11496 [Strigomonas culicis]
MVDVDERARVGPRHIGARPPRSAPRAAALGLRPCLCPRGLLLHLHAERHDAAEDAVVDRRVRADHLRLGHAIDGRQQVQEGEAVHLAQRGVRPQRAVPGGGGAHAVALRLQQRVEVVRRRRRGARARRHAAHEVRAGGLPDMQQQHEPPERGKVEGVGDMVAEPFDAAEVVEHV